MVGRVPGCGVHAVKQLLEIEHVIIWLPYKSHVLELAIRLISSYGQRIPNVLLVPRFEKSSQLFVCSDEWRCSLAFGEGGHARRQRQVEQLAARHFERRGVVGFALLSLAGDVTRHTRQPFQSRNHDNRLESSPSRRNNAAASRSSDCLSTLQVQFETEQLPARDCVAPAGTSQEEFGHRVAVEVDPLGAEVTRVTIRAECSIKRRHPRSQPRPRFCHRVRRTDNVRSRRCLARFQAFADGGRPRA
jgi:hypothetical protein